MKTLNLALPRAFKRYAVLVLLASSMSACHSRLIGSSSQGPDHSDVLKMSGIVTDSHQTFRIDSLMKQGNGALVCEINGVRLNQYEFKYSEQSAYKSVTLRDLITINADGSFTIPQPRKPVALVGDTWTVYFE